MVLPPADVTLSDYYNKFVTEQNSIRRKYEEQLGEQINSREVCKEELLPELHKIADCVDIDIPNSKEFTENQIDSDKPLAVEINKALGKVTNIDKRQILKKVMAYCEKMNNANATINLINILDNRTQIDRKTFKTAVKYYYNVGVMKCLIEGYAYRISSGLMDLMVCDWNKGKKRVLDYAATKAKKQEIIDAGLKPYDEEEAKVYKARGLKYDGVDYKVYDRHDSFLALGGYHSKYADDRYICFSPVRSNQDKTYAQLAATCKDLNDVYNLDIQGWAKVAVACIVDPTVRLKYARNETKLTRMKGQHNTKFRIRYEQ